MVPVALALFGGLFSLPRCVSVWVSVLNQKYYLVVRTFLSFTSFVRRSEVSRLRLARAARPGSALGVVTSSFVVSSLMLLLLLRGVVAAGLANFDCAGIFVYDG